jgi:hypothetical protein
MFDWGLGEKYHYKNDNYAILVKWGAKMSKNEKKMYLPLNNVFK